MENSVSSLQIVGAIDPILIVQNKASDLNRRVNDIITAAIPAKIQREAVQNLIADAFGEFYISTLRELGHKPEAGSPPQ